MNKLMCIIAVIGMAIGISGCGQVNPGEVAFKTQWGEITSRDVLHEGLWFYSPFGGNLVTYDTKNQIMKFKTEQYTKDIQQADAQLSITYNIRPDAVIKMHQTTGKDYANKIIAPAILGSVKDVVGKWNATDIIGKREEATKFIYASLVDKLNPFGINITLVEILDISFKPKFEDAVEAKQIAEQEANRAKNLTVKIREEAQQKIIAAEAEAKAMEVRAKALESNKSLVEYEAVMRWDGKLPTYMMGDSVPFINMGMKGAN